MSTTAGDAKVYRGASLEEILPRIREELGHDAVVLREREGLVGGIGGFFARRCIEVEAAPGWPYGGDETVLALPARAAAGVYESLDDAIEAPTNSFMEALLDRAAALDELFVPLGDDAAGSKPHRQAGDVALAEGPPAGEPAAAPCTRDALADPPAPQPVRAVSAEGSPDETEAEVRTALARTGMSGAAIEMLMERVRAHLHPLAPTASVRELARLAVRSSLTTPLGWEGRRTIALVGLEDAPAARSVAALAAAHAAAGISVAVLALGGGRPAAKLAAHLVDDDVDVLLARDVGDVERALAETATADLVLALSTPVTGDDLRSAARSAGLLIALDPDETHLIVPAGARPERVRRALDRIDDLVAVDYLLPCAAGLADEIGGAVGVALERRLALRWIASTGTRVRAHPADPVMLAEAMLP